MAVKFEEIVFQNENSVPVTVTIEAPPGHIVVRQHPVGENSSYQVEPGVHDCSAVLFVAQAPSHDPERQQFSVAGSPTHPFLKRADAKYKIGSFHGAVVARTERG